MLWLWAIVTGGYSSLRILFDSYCNIKGIIYLTQDFLSHTYTHIIDQRFIFTPVYATFH